MIQSKIWALGHSKIPEEAIMRRLATCIARKRMSSLSNIRWGVVIRDAVLIRFGCIEEWQARAIVLVYIPWPNSWLMNVSFFILLNARDSEGNRTRNCAPNHTGFYRSISMFPDKLKKRRTHNPCVISSSIKDSDGGGKALIRP